MDNHSTPPRDWAHSNSLIEYRVETVQQVR